MSRAVESSVVYHASLSSLLTLGGVAAGYLISALGLWRGVAVVVGAVALFIGISWLVVRANSVRVESELSSLARYVAELAAAAGSDFNPSSLGWPFSGDALVEIERRVGATEIFVVSRELSHDSPGGLFFEVVASNLN